MKTTIILTFLFSVTLSIGQEVSQDSLKKLFNQAHFHSTNSKGDSIKGIQLSNLYLSLDPKSPEAYNNRGLAYQRCKEYRLAIMDFEKARKIDSQNVKPLYNIGNANYNSKNYNLAIKYLDSCVILNPNHVNSYYLLAASYVKLNQRNTALRYFNKALSIEPNHYKSLKDRGLTYTELNKLDLALTDFKKGIALNPNDYEIYAGQAIAYFKMGNWDSSYKSLINAKKLSSDSKIDYFLGMIHLIKKEKPKACACFKEGMEKKNKDALEEYNRNCR